MRHTLPEHGPRISNARKSGVPHPPIAKIHYQHTRLYVIGEACPKNPEREGISRKKWHEKQGINKARQHHHSDDHNTGRLCPHHALLNSLIQSIALVL
jgi:hypothetical protein